ncbi:hypothetical protein [Streptomyces chartreusis]|uniref:hypothetical protein n=1 Tax=Streptomyces chartreusis TaxID=1969 RepID=UPI00381BDD43
MTLAIFGLGKDYTVALVGLAGTLLGAVVAFLTMQYQVRRQEKERQLDHATKEAGQALLKLLRLFRESGTRAGWEDDMTDQLDVLKLTTPLFHNEDLRNRLNATVDIVSNWHFVIFDGPNLDEYEDSSPRIREVLQHAIDCLGAVRRGARRIPDESDAFKGASNNIDSYWDYMGGR